MKRGTAKPEAPPRLLVGVGSHEPIFHRLRTGNAAADEWARWEQETSEQNLDTLQELGVSTAHIACTKGFGLETEKPLIARAADFAARAASRGIQTSVYVQGFPVYYETFLHETPAAVDWLAKRQNGDFIPWGGQTFRRWMDPARTEFHEYQERLLTYVFDQFQPNAVFMDNTVPPWCYSAACRESFRAYLRARYTEAAARHEFGISSFDTVDLPHFDPVYFPPDALRIVKDPLLQEWAFWYSHLSSSFLARIAALIKRLAPGTRFQACAGCDVLRYNTLFNYGVDFEDRFAVCDGLSIEESAWRPGVVEPMPSAVQTVMDERSPTVNPVRSEAALRVSTDARWIKISSHFGRTGTNTMFWGESNRASKLVALSHSMAFSQAGNRIGTIGPLAASPRMLDDLRDVVDWARTHIDVLSGRDAPYSPVGVWRGTRTLGFIRHRPVWEACAVEQLLFEQHVPFTILLDGVLERFMTSGGRLLILPGTACVSDAQVAAISAFVAQGGALLLLGEAGTRDERTRLRRTYAFEPLFGGAVPSLESYGPPHWVPELDFRAMPERLAASYGRGRVVAIKAITPRTTLDLTRDPYMPERQVMVRDIVPPANEDAILSDLDALLGAEVRVTAPRWTLCEYWRRGDDLVICLANLRQGHDGGPVILRLPSSWGVRKVQVHQLLEAAATSHRVVRGRVALPTLPHFAAILVPSAPCFGPR